WAWAIPAVDVVGACGLTLGDAGAALLGLDELCFGSCGVGLVVLGGRALVSPGAAHLVRPVVLAAKAAAVGHRRYATGARTVRRVASAGPGDRPRLRDGHERCVYGAARLGCRRHRFRGARDREGKPAGA